jgi:hypothetical protein
VDALVLVDATLADVRDSALTVDTSDVTFDVREEASMLLEGLDTAGGAAMLIDRLDAVIGVSIGASVALDAADVLLRVLDGVIGAPVLLDAAGEERSTEESEILDTFRFPSLISLKGIGLGYVYVSLPIVHDAFLSHITVQCV